MKKECSRQQQQELLQDNARMLDLTALGPRWTKSMHLIWVKRKWTQNEGITGAIP